MDAHSRGTRAPIAASLLLVAVTTVTVADQDCSEGGFPAEAAGDWRSLSEPAKALRVGPGLLYQYTPEEGATSTVIVGAARCALAALEDGDLEALSVTIEDGTLVVRRGGVREEYLRLAETPPELRSDALAIRPSQEVSPERVESIRQELKRRHEEDQAFLKASMESGRDFSDYEPLRRENNRYLRTLLDDVGWIGAETFGVRTTYYAFMLIQHSSDLDLMLAALPEVERDLKDADYSESYALLFDRAQVMQGEPQRFGTQMARLPNGDAIVLPMEDPENVDERRSSLGLPPLDQYLDGAAKYLFDGRRPQLWDARAVAAALSAGGGGPR